MIEHHLANSYISFNPVYVFKVSDEFVREVQRNNITVAMQEIFLADPYTRVEKLKVSWDN